MKTFCNKANECNWSIFGRNGVDTDIIKLIKNEFQLDELILVARTGDLSGVLGRAISYKKANIWVPKIYQILDNGRYIRHDFEKYQKSFNWWALIECAKRGAYDIRYTVRRHNISRMIERFSNEQYESFVGF